VPLPPERIRGISISTTDLGTQVRDYGTKGSFDGEAEQADML
jgi:hypothetical protein